MNNVLLSVFGDRTTKIEGQTASLSEELIAIMTNNESVSKTKPMPIIEDLDIQGGKFTLTDTPSSGITPTVYKLDPVTGMELIKLTAGSPSTNQNDYSISSKIITCHTSVTKIRVYYDADKVVQAIEVGDVTPKSYEMMGILVAKSIDTGKLYRGIIELPNATIQPSFSLSAKNDSSAPDAVNISITAAFDSGKKYPYAINFFESEE